MKNILTILLLFITSISYGANCSSISSGDWNDDDIWSCGRKPQAGDNVVVNIDHFVSLTNSENLSGSATLITVYGELHFQSGKKLDLASGSGVVIENGGWLTAGGGGGSSNLITIGGVNMWSAGCGCGNGCEPLCGNISGHIVIGTALPVELLYFIGKSTNEYINFTWEITSEINLSHYQIHRSIDGFSWSIVANIKGGQNKYQHSLVCTEDCYYKLVSIDLDGYTEHFNTIFIECNNIPLYNPQTKSIKTNTEFRVYDSNGILVDSYINFADLSKYKSGLYFIHTLNGKKERILVIN